MPLIYNFFIILLFSLFASWQMRTSKSKNAYLLICFVVVVYIHSMVDVNSLPDLPSYKRAFEETFSLSWIKCLYWGNISYKMEPGYVLFYKMVSVISHNFQFFLWVNSIVLLSLYFLLIKNYSKYYIISVLCLLLGSYNQSLFVLRQHLAATILLASFPLIRDRKQVKFLGLVLASFFIHQSALIFIPVYYLYNFDKRNLKIAIVTIGLLLFFGFQKFLIWGSEITMSNEGYVYTEEGGGLNYKPALLAMFWLAVYCYVAKKHVFDDGLNRFLLVVSSLGLVLLIAGVGFDPAGRLSIYFSCNFLLMPVIWYYMKKDTYARLLLLLLYLALGYYVAFMGNSWGFIEHLELVSWL